MKIKSNMATILFFGYISFGCVSPTQYNSDDIVNKYYQSYTNKVLVVEDLDNDDISSILREFVVNITTNTPSSWTSLEQRENEYMLNLTTNVISRNYPVVASTVEIQISDGFLDDGIAYYKVIRPEWYSDMGTALSSISSRLIDKINRFEWFRNDDKWENKQ